MAARKKSDVVENRAWENGAEAFGAKYLKPGFTLSPELDLQYALGRGSAGFGPLELLPNLAVGKKIPWSFEALPVNVILAELRRGEDHTTNPLVFEANPAPLTEKEGCDHLRKDLSWFVHRPVLIRAIEALIGNNAALPAYLDGLENAKKQTWDNGNSKTFSYALYGMLLRATKKNAEDARKRITKLYEKVKNTYGASELDVLLHGKEGLARSGYKYVAKFDSYQTGGDGPVGTSEVCFIDDDPDYVASQFAALWEAFKWKIVNRMNGPAPARLFFLAGEKAFETELKVVAKYPGTKQAEALESYVDFKSPGAARCILRLSGPSSKVAKKARAWFEAQAQWTTPLLKQWAKSGDEDAALAKALL